MWPAAVAHDARWLADEWGYWAGNNGGHNAFELRAHAPAAAPWGRSLQCFTDVAFRNLRRMARQQRLLEWDTCRMAAGMQNNEALLFTDDESGRGRGRGRGAEYQKRVIEFIAEFIAIDGVACRVKRLIARSSHRRTRTTPCTGYVVRQALRQLQRWVRHGAADWSNATIEKQFKRIL